MGPSDLASSDPAVVLEAFAAVRGASSGVISSPVVLEPRPHRPVLAADPQRPGDAVPETPRPSSGGLRCERIFGSARELLCACGKLSGEAHEGARCNECGVEVVRAHERERRTAHLVVPTPLLHPALAGRVAEVLGLEREEVLAVARMRAWIDRTSSGLRVTRVPLERDDGESPWGEDESALLDLSGRLLRHLPDGGLERTESLAGGEGLAELLAERGHEELLFRDVPVPALGDRPLERGVGGDVVLGPIDRAYVPLVAAAQRAARLVELNAPFIIVLGARAAVQRAFEQMLASLAGGGELAPDPTVRAEYLPSTERDPEPFSFDAGGPRPERPIDVAFTADDELFLSFPFASFRLGLDGRVRAAWPRIGGTITGGGPAHVVLRGAPPAVHELATGAPVAGWPEGVHAWAFAEAQERGVLVDPIRGVATELTDLGDYPFVVRGTPDARSVWVEDHERSGGIYRVADGVLEASCAAWGEVVEGGVPTLRANGRITRTPDEMAAMNVVEGAAARTEALADELGFVSYTPHHAVVLTPGAGFRVLHEQRVVDRTRSLLHVAFPIAAAAFAPGGARLALVSRDAAHVIDVETSTSIAVLDLAPILREVTFRKRTRTKPEREAQLLARFGTVSAMLAADDATLESAGARRPAALRAKLA